MNEWMNVWMNEIMNEIMNEWMNKWMNCRTLVTVITNMNVDNKQKGWSMDEFMHACMNEWMNKYMNEYLGWIGLDGIVNVDKNQEDGYEQCHPTRDYLRVHQETT